MRKMWPVYCESETGDCSDGPMVVVPDMKGGVIIRCVKHSV